MILYGGGGHASVVTDCLLSKNIQLKGFVDDADLSKKYAHLYLGKYDSSLYKEELFIICIGDNKIRKLISERIAHSFGNAIHQLAYISALSKIGVGNMVFQFAVIQPNSVIGSHCIINTAAVVEHDCKVGDYAHIASQAVLCGHAEVGEGTLIGAGAIVLSKVKIGKWCVVGAGAVVTKDVPDFSLVKGVPGVINAI